MACRAGDVFLVGRDVPGRVGVLSVTCLLVSDAFFRVCRIRAVTGASLYTGFTGFTGFTDFAECIHTVARRWFPFVVFHLWLLPLQQSLEKEMEFWKFQGCLRCLGRAVTGNAAICPGNAVHCHQALSPAS